jgi:RNA polymerase sigma factor (sigma-70 family)
MRDRLRTALAPDGGPTDGQLLDRFVASRDEAAFAALVRRHGPMVLGVCRRVVGDHHLAEDAFQAAFLVLARRARAVAPADEVGNFLFGVAYRIALRGRALAARRHLREAPLPDLPDRPRPPDEAAAARETAEAVCREALRLPQKYRVPIVRCDLEGRPRRDVAAELRLPEGTLSSRLAAGREMLADRLRRRGVALGVGGLAAALGAAAGAVSPERAAAVAQAARGFILGGTGSGPARAAAVELAEGALRAMFWKKLRTALVAAVAVALTAVVTVASLAGRADQEPAPAEKKEPRVTASADGGPGRLLFWRLDDLVLVDPDGQNETRAFKGGDALAPATGARLSPDGRRLAFVRSANAPGDGPPPNEKVYVRRVDETGVGTELGVTAFWIVWSPDGKGLLAGSAIKVDEPDDKAKAERQRLGQREPPPKLKFTHRLVPDVETKIVEELKLPDDHAVCDWSPDGKWFLTFRLEGESARLFRVSRDGSQVEALTEQGKGAFYCRISPDGKSILFLGDDPKRPGDPGSQSKMGLLVMDLKDRKAVRVEEQPLEGFFEGFCWSPDGKRIAYILRKMPEAEGEETETILVVADADGKNPRTVARAKSEFRQATTMSFVDWR